MSGTAGGSSENGVGGAADIRQQPQGSVPTNANEACPGVESENAGKSSSCEGCPNQAACASGETKKKDPAIEQIARKLASVKHIILVLSGKGGVGKSTFASQLAWTLAQHSELQVGLLDVDICGPSAPRMTGVENEEVHKSNMGWSPVYADDNLGVMSVGFMLQSREDAIIWRGPRKNGLIKQFLADVYWGELDYLVIDTPPGTSDEHISVTQYLKDTRVDGAVIVTTPQEVALLDVRKEISFCRKVGMPILGVVENMSGFVCPCCRAQSDIFPPVTGGARQMATDMNIAFLGGIPLDPKLLMACEQGVSYTRTYPDAPAVPSLKTVVRSIRQRCNDPDADLTTTTTTTTTAAPTTAAPTTTATPAPLTNGASLQNGTTP